MHEHDQDADRLIGEIARQLKQPVVLDRALDDRAMAEIRRPKRPGRTIAWIGLAVAAGLAALALVRTRRGGEGPTGQQIAFSLESPTAHRVTLVGDFNNWDPAATPLERVSSAGPWRAVVPLTPGRYEFTYVIDGSHWIRDPGLPQATGEDFGQPTSVITVLGRGQS